MSIAFVPFIKIILCLVVLVLGIVLYIRLMRLNNF